MTNWQTQYTDETIPLLLQAIRGDELSRPPIWMMRQAGRYMAEYQAIRQNVSFVELCKNVDLATEVSLQPIHAFDMDAAIMFSDILVPVEAMGVPFEIGDGGPKLKQTMRTQEDIDQLVIPDPNQSMPYVMNILGSLRQELKQFPDNKALIGFAGAPWTLATYMIEGGSSKHFTHIKTMMYSEPKLLHQLLDKLAQTVTLYLNAQIEAGAQVVQLFDTWAGLLPKALYQEFVLPYHQQIIDQLHRDKAPVVLYVNRSAHLLELMQQAKPDVISVDELTALPEARQRLGHEITLQGNLDQTMLFGNADVLKARVETLLKEGGNRHYIFNLGHGILPKTPTDNVRLVVNTVKAHSHQKEAALV